jgi:transcription initiation factor IIE alpha subunit
LNSSPTLERRVIFNKLAETDTQPNNFTYNWEHTDTKLKGTIKLKKREKIEEITKEAEDLALERWFAISVKLFQPCGREKRK